MKIKRVASLLLAFAILLGGLPFIELTALKVQAATDPDYVFDDANKVLTINNEAGWNYFAQYSKPGIPAHGIDTQFRNWTVKLANNISITGPVIPSADDFSGAFDGQNHSITLPQGDSYFAEDGSTPLGADVGLFRNVADSGKLENLIVRLNTGSTLHVLKSLMSWNVATDINCFGAVVGKLSDNAKMKNCALVGGGTVSYKNKKQVGQQPMEVCVGSMVGQIINAASAENCYSDVNVKAWGFLYSTYSGYDPHLTFVVGGLFGNVLSNVSIKNCIGINQQINVSNLGDRYYVYAGGISGNSGEFINSYVKGSKISVWQINNQQISAGNEEVSGAIPRAADVSVISGQQQPINCAGNTIFSVKTNESTINENGYVGNIDTVTAERMGTEWVNTNQKVPNLKWLVNAGPSTATIDTQSGNGSLTIQDRYAELNTVADYQAGEDATWGFTMSVPIKGRTAPISDKLSMAVEWSKDTTPEINKKTITLPTTTGIEYYYKVSDDADAIVYTSIKQLTNAGYIPYSVPVVLATPDAIAKTKLLVVAATKNSSTKLVSTTSEYDLQTAVTSSATSVDLTVVNTPAAGYEPKTITTGALYYTQDMLSTGALPTDTDPLTLDKILGTVDTKYATNTVDYIAAGSTAVNVFAGKDRFISDGAGSRFVATATKSSVKGDVAPRPTISPRGTGIISSGVTIAVPAGTKVYYTWTVDPAAGSAPVHPELKSDGTSKDPAITKEYTANTVLPFPDHAAKLVVRAIAYQSGKTISDEDYVEYSNDANLPQPYVPKLLVAGADHSDAATYPDASEIKFTHANLAEGLVYFTVNSSIPSASNANAYRYGQGQTYDETKPFTLPTISGRDFIEVKAVFHSNKTMLDSPVGTYRVHTKQVLKAPVANIPTGKSVPPGEKLLLSLSDGAITQLNSTGKISAARIKYSDGTDGNIATDDASCTLVGTDKPINGTEYISYNVNETNEAYSLPIIRYKLGAGATDIDKSGTLCQYGQRRVLSKTVKGITTVTVTYINPLPIVLTGEADKVITVNTVALSEVEAYSDSLVASFEYTIFKAAAKPTAIPATSDTEFTMLAPGSFINLASATANTSIYYTINNSVPIPQDYLDWVKNGSDATKKPATMLYVDTVGIVMPDKANTLFTVRAVAHSNDNTFVDSAAVQFTYQMPSQVNIVYVSPSQGSVVAGTPVQLKCGTADAHIFYKLHTSAPSLTDPAVVPKPYIDQLFDTTVPIVIDKETWITAIAEKDGVTSAMTSYHYTLYSKTAKPTAIPATTPEAIATLKPGDVINLSTSTANASIYYTIDNSHPSPQEYLAWVQAGSDATKKPATMLYKTLEGITMPNVTTFFTIRAVAQSTEQGSEDSPEAQFTYQPPAAVQAVFVSPTAGAVVANQSVTLKCATPDAKIFYRILSQKPANITDPENIPKPYKDQIFDATVPIVITKNVWIVALAEKDGMVSVPTMYEYTVSPTTTEPTASLKTGSVVNRGTRIRLSGAGNIAFTLDGSDPKAAVAAMQATGGGAKAAEAPPKAAEVFFGDSFVVDADFGKSITVRAFTYGEGRTPSNVVSFIYTVCEKDVGYLTAMPKSGSVLTSGDQITLSTTISDGKIFYATGADTPSIVNRYEDAAIDAAENEPYTHYQWVAGANTVQGTNVKLTGASGSTVTVKAIAAANGAEGGATQVFTYTIRDKTASPTASIPTGAVTLEGATVTLSAREGDIFFTTDGTRPSTSSRLYTQPIEVPGSMVLKAIAVAKDKTESDVVEYHYSYADQAFAPGMSIPSGEIEQGKLLSLSSETKDASIYYTTNGAEPTEKSTLYTSPISIMRPVTIKAIAVCKGLRNSAINSASYTVIEPPPPKTETDGNEKPQGQLNSLVSRRTYFDETAGPKFSAFVVRDAATNAVLSANEGIVPKAAKLTVKRIDSSDSDREAVRTALGNEIVALYDVSLEKDGEKVDPVGEVELGITIPEEYQNSLVTVCRIGADNTVEEYEPRRSGTAAYFIVNGKLDRYAVTIPQELAVASGKITTMSIVKWVGLALVGLLLGGALIIFILRKRAKAAKGEVSLEGEESFEEFFAQGVHEDTRNIVQDNTQENEQDDTNE